jgi:Flp pilus assembly protein TadD/uncharacterized protein involved in exopolysaccharide biosynthesis
MNLTAPEWPPAAPGVSNFLEIAEPCDLAWFGRRYWKWILGGGLLSLLLGGVWLYAFPPVYQSRAKVRFMPPQVAGRFVSPNFSMEVGQRMHALSQLLSSRLTASKMIQTFSLYPERLRKQTAEDLTTRFLSDLRVGQIGNLPGDDHRAVPTLEITYVYQDPDKAQKVVQKLIEQIYEENRKYRGDQSLGTTEFLEEQLVEAEEKVLEAEQRLGELQDAAGLTMSQARLGQSTARSYVVDSRLRDLRHDRRLLEERKGAKKAEWEQLELLQRRIETRPVEFYMPEFEAMPNYWRLREDVTAAKNKLERLEERYNQNMPDVVSARNELREAEARLDRFHKDRGMRLRNRDLDANAAKIALAKLEMQNLDRDAAEQVREEGELRAEAQKLREQMVQPPGQEVELLVAKREYESAKQQHEQLLKKHEESRVASEMERRGQGETVELIEPASRAERPQSPTAPVTMAYALGLGLIASLMGCFAHALTAPRVLHERHLEKWAGLPVLANFTGGGRLLNSRKLAGLLGCLAFLLMTGCGLKQETAAELFAQGQQAEKEGKPHVALLKYRKALRLDAKCGPAHEAVGRIALRRGELEAARESLARAVEIAPDRYQLLKQLAEVSVQLYFSDPGRPVPLLREIEDMAARLRTKWPGEPDGYLIAAQVLIERHRGDEANAILEKGSSVVKRSEGLRAQLAAVLFRSGEHRKAQEVLVALIEASPKYPDAYDLLYLQFMQRRKSAEAREVLDKKWRNLGDLESALQLAAHDDARGEREAAAKMLAGLENLALQRPLGMGKIGDFWLERAQWGAARQAYQTGMDREPGRRTDYVARLAEWHLAQGQTQQARALIEAENQKQPGVPVIAAYLAAVRLGEVPAERRLEERKRLESILLRMPESPFVRYHLGRAYLLDQMMGQAAEQFEKSVKLDANYAPGWLALAELEMSRGDLSAAEQRAERVLRTHPGNVRAMLVTARAQARRGKLAEAGQTLASVIRKEPQNLEAKYLLAVSNAGQGHLDAALKQVQEGQKMAPRDARWPIAMASLLSRMGNAELARQTLEQALGVAGQQPQILEQLASVQLELKDGKGAEKTFLRLASMDQKNFEYKLGVAGAKALSGDRQGALKLYGELQKTAARDVRVWLQPAAILGEMGRTDEARQAYEEALRLEPNHPMALNNLAWLLLENKSNERQALELAQRARRGVRQSPEVDGTLAAAYTRLAMHRNAAAVYEEMLSYVPASDRSRVEKLLDEARRRQRKEQQS